ncbi:McrB family protein [Paenibacillus sp. Y412MC10]|uniref:McrB family protein n=1 Tax=Geobacillus sp. (strain Y412MC10) TaxID=481743 RepID=UPI0021B1EB36|nr:AAA family ATPase [Paenibacillus sp. Y412MC10]
MSINSIIDSELFVTYNKISKAVKKIQKEDKTLNEKKLLMTELRRQNENTLKSYNNVAAEFARSFIYSNQLSDDHIIEARIGSPTPYGNQPKNYLWSGISIYADKSYSFQYSWVFQKDLLEVTFCFGSGGSSTGRIDAHVKEKKETQMKALEQRFINILMEEQYKSIVLQLLQEEGFVITSEWLSSGEKIKDIESYISYIQTKGGAKTGLTKFFKPDEILNDGFALDAKLFHYFHLFRPIWEQLHLKDNETKIDGEFIEKETFNYKKDDDQITGVLQKIKKYINNHGFLYPDKLIENFYLSLKTKPFVILAGVSGTGKTKLVRLFAESLGATGDNHQFTLIPVRPDWSDPSDLLGYKDLSGAFRPGRLAEVLVEASQPANQHKPYFICLDEMNLARVEYYFSDVLSVIETQEWKQDRILTSKLINRESLLQEDQSVYGDLSIPDNVYLIGTVNMDETTHPFSKKVLDRANTIEFNYIDLQQYPSLALQEEETLLPVHNSFLRSEYLQLVDVYADYTDLVHTTTEKLVKINHILEEIHSHVGFRIRDSICFYMVYNQRYELLTPDEAFDLQLLQKILPRVQGSSLSVKRVLLKLLEGALGRKLSSFSDLMEDASNIDQEWNDDQEEKKAKHPLSARKIAFMLRRLEEDGFTSYWLS